MYTNSCKIFNTYIPSQYFCLIFIGEDNRKASIITIRFYIDLLRLAIIIIAEVKVKKDNKVINVIYNTER